MDNIDKLIELSGRQSLHENKTQPKDKGTILATASELRMLRHNASSDRAKIEELSDECERLTVRLQTWHEAQNMTKQQAVKYLARPDNQP